MANIKLQGIEDVRKILKTASPEMVMSVNQELHKIANEIKSESMGLVPHHEGAL